MNLKQLADFFGYSENSLKTNFKRTIINLEKKGIIIVKKGYGKKATYQIKYKEVLNE